MSNWIATLRTARLAPGLMVMSLATACTFPREAPPLQADISSIGMVQNAQGEWQALPPDCTALSEVSVLADWNTPRHSMAFGCATYTNLARQIAQPADLVQPQPYAGTDARRAGDAVQRYLDGRVTPLSERNTSVTTGGSR